MKVQYLGTILKNKIARYARKNAHEQHGVQMVHLKSWIERPLRPKKSKAKFKLLLFF